MVHGSLSISVSHLSTKSVTFAVVSYAHMLTHSFAVAYDLDQCYAAVSQFNLASAHSRARKLIDQGSQAPPGDFDQLVEGPWPISTSCPPRGSLWRGKCLLAGDLVETPPVSGPKFRSAGRRPFQNLRNFGPSARKFRPVDELVSPDPACDKWFSWQLVTTVVTARLDGLPGLLAGPSRKDQ
jgi:hypothetical protein